MSENNVTDTKTYNIITRKNIEFYNSFDAKLKNEASKFQDKTVGSIVNTLIDKKVIIVGLKNDPNFDNFGSVYIRDKDMSSIILNANSLNINITTAETPSLENIIIYTYMLLIRGMVHINNKELKNDEEFIDKCIKLLSLIIYKNLDLRGITEKQNSLIRSLIMIFFYKFILNEQISKPLGIIKKTQSKEVYDFYLEKKQMIDKYQSFSMIFRGFYDLGLIANRNPKILMASFFDKVGIIGFSVMVTKDLGGFISSIILSKYNDTTFKGLFIDYNLNSYFENYVFKLYKNQSFK